MTTEQWHEERRKAWDMYVAGFVSSDYRYSVEYVLQYANSLLAERDKRFPKPMNE